MARPLSAQTSSPLDKVVIDPGHGGSDPGCISPNQKLKEKTVCLAVALELGRLIKAKYPHIQVIYTRTKDVYVALDKRAEIANKNHADLFLSIHVNSAAKSAPTGSETLVMGTHKSEANLEVCMRENAVITFEEDYQTKYAGFDPRSPESFIIFNLMQNAHLEQSLALAGHIQKAYSRGPITRDRGVKQGGLLVLWKCTMPAVLTELGFINNANDYKTLSTSAGQKRLAACLFAAFEQYKKDYEKAQVAPPALQAASDSLYTHPKAATEAAPGVQTAAGRAEAKNPGANPGANTGATPSAKKSYRVQILAVTKPLKAGAPDLKGHKGAQYLRKGVYYKYTLGDFATAAQAQAYCKTLRKDFPGAFVICVQNGQQVAL